MTGLIDYEAFCGAKACDAAGAGLSVLDPSSRITCQQYIALCEMEKACTAPAPPASARKGAAGGAAGAPPPPPVIRIDVRPPVHYAICSLPGFENIPIVTLHETPPAPRVLQLLEEAAQRHAKVIVLCRRGNDSQRAVVILQRLFAAASLAKQGQECEDSAKTEASVGKQTTGAGRGGAEQAAVLQPLLDVQDLKGGLLAWSRMHPDFPIY